jgi:hypothetical protein
MKRILTVLSFIVLIAGFAYGGNPDRSGEAGAAELNMNGWARSSGLWSMNTATVEGVESERINIAGLAFVPKTEISAAYTLWLQGSDVGVAQAGFAQNIKNDNVIAITMQALNLGEIERTTTANPEGGIGTYKPAFINLGISYARKFSKSISGGVTARLVDEGLGNLNAVGFAIDAGLQYVTGPKDNIHFGVSLRNVGTPLKFSGDALSTEVEIFSSSTYQLAEESKANSFELPTQLNIGAAYDFWMGSKIETKPRVYKQNFRLSAMANFTSNAFAYDYYGVGLEFGYKEIFMLRCAYRFENGQFNAATRLDAYTGFAAGMSVDIPFKKTGSPRLALDYSFRATSPFQGTHSVGLRFNL